MTNKENAVATRAKRLLSEASKFSERNDKYWC
jgi:hypothetical protein